MKNIILLTCTLVALLIAQLDAQTPAQFQYQAVARNASGQLLANQNIGVRFTILQGGSSGTSVFQEEHSFVMTNQFGLFTIQIGSLSGNALSTINWGSSAYWLRVEMRPSPSDSYQQMGSPTQFLSVPYAEYARNGGDTSPTNELQTLTKTGNVVTLSNGGGSFTDEVNDADASPTNELQTITKTGNVVTLSNGGGSFTDEVNDADASPINELQTITKTGNVVTLSNGGGSFTDEVNDADSNPINEIQQLSLVGNNLSISGNGGNTIVLPSSNRVAFLKDVKFVDTPGGDVTGEFWHSRILNTISGDNSFVSLSGGSTGTNGTATQFILQPGTYQIEAFCPAQQINVHVAKLVNVTDGLDVLIGSAGYSPVNVHAISPSIIMGQFTINSAKTFAIMHRGASSRPNGFGVSHWWSDNVYTQVKIAKVD